MSKKKIRNINLAENTIWCWLNEKEMLTVSSAIVDAYLHKGTKLYTVTYIEPNAQKDSIPTYPSNLDVQRLIESDPNIVNKAKDYLAAQLRPGLDQRLKALTTEAVTKVASEVSKEVTSRQGAIKKDAELQKSQQNTQAPQTEAPIDTQENTTQDNATDNTTKEGAKSGFFN
ncbi:MAG: hypothetical protein N3B21_00295 [Clostridia bacterium]|nr:hypothetical protein [Clostridia bacterium]